MFYETDKKDIVDYDPRERYQEFADLHALNRWAWTKTEWVRITLEKIRLRNLIRDSEKTVD